MKNRIVDLFSYDMPRFKFDKDKPINLFEAFSGIGTQAMALKRLGLKVNHVGISEIDRHAIKSYEAIHGKVKNYGGIGSFEKFPPNIDICTWSFPCQDISLAGKQKGMRTGSRSNYGYTFLKTIKNTPYEDRPQVLLMENVKALMSKKFEKDWKNIRRFLKSLGYENWYTNLIATDYGIPQTRDRVFIVSIKGKYKYEYHKPFELTTRLKDYLEDEVDEKYYLSDKQVEQIASWNAYQDPLANAKDEEDITMQTITAKGNTSMNSSMLLIKEATKKGYSIAEDGDGVYINRPHQKRGVVQKDKIQTIKTQTNDIGVVVKNKKEQLVDELLKNNIVKDGDVINHSYTISNVRQELKDYIETDNGLSPTLTTRPDTLGVVVENKIYNPLKDKTPNGWHFEQEVYLDKGNVRTLKAGGGSGNIPKVIENKLYDFNSSEKFRHELGTEIAPTIKTKNHLAVGESGLRIRKLTPLECWRLMGVDDDDFYKAQGAGVSDSQLYKQAGNAIVVDVLYYIFKEMI